MTQDDINAALRFTADRFNDESDISERDLAFWKTGMESAAAFLEDQFYNFGPLATAIRTLKDGGTPCEDCGYPLPQHDPSCVSRNL